MILVFGQSYTWQNYETLSWTELHLAEKIFVRNFLLTAYQCLREISGTSWMSKDKIGKLQTGVDIPTAH